MSTSVLDDLGEEVTGILAPVSLCMALTVALVKALNPKGDSDSQRVVVATAFYEEKVTPLAHPTAFPLKFTSGICGRKRIQLGRSCRVPS